MTPVTQDRSRILKAFRGKGALSGGFAKPLSELGLRDSLELRTLVLANVVLRAGPERYFLDEQALASRRQLQAGTVVRIAVALGLVVLGVALLAGRG